MNKEILYSSCGMDQLKWTTPIKNNKNYDLGIKSPVIYKTPVKQHETGSKHTPYKNNMSCFGVLPSHITPPSGLTKFIARNPFETDLTNRLHLSMISPTVFSKVSSSAQNSPQFSWSVDELALIQPAKIEEFPNQQIYSADPETEIKAQEAIDRFFKENQKIISSPWEPRKKDNRTKLDTDTPIRATSDSNSESFKLKKDGWSQTVLSFPPELPPYVEEILKPYFTFTQDQSVENDDANSSNSSLRRKLFFNHNDYLENEEESSDCLSPVKMNRSLILSSSPPQSGMLVHGAPLKHSENVLDSHEISPIASQNISSPNISPIRSIVNNMSCENVKSRSRLVARLDFTGDMSIDRSSLQHKENSNNYSFDDTPNKIGAQPIKNKLDHLLNADDNCMYVDDVNGPKKKIMSRYSTCLDRNPETEDSEFNRKRNDVPAFRQLTESESCVFQQTNPMLGTSDQQSISNSAQDTGYQTYSMNSMTNMTDSYNITPVKQKIHWGDQILTTDDECRLSAWKENMRNMFSSTPSRSNREKDNHIL